MAVGTSSFSTGLATLPDVGRLEYNGASFSSLFHSRLSWKLVPDLSGRTVKWAEVTITADGPVTLNAVDDTTDDSMASLRQVLAQYAGKLTYFDKGFGLQVINQPGSPFRDVNWGPKTEVLDFQPLGGSKSALVSWRVTTCISEYALKVATSGGGGGNLLSGIGGSPGGAGPLLQFNEETSNTYDEDAHSTFSVRGTLEIPLTRTTVNDRTLDQTVDDFRRRFLNFALDYATGVDLTRFRVARRNFNVSRDKRVLDWEFVLEELPFMPLPPGCPTARGSFTFGPGMAPKGKIGAGQAFVAWNCSLTCTYTVAKGVPRRVAWHAFLSLLQWRMMFGAFGFVPEMNRLAPNEPNVAPLPLQLERAVQNVNGAQPALNVWLDVLAEENRRVLAALRAQNALPKQKGQKTWLYHFGGREGLYLDSRTVTFEASWKLLTRLPNILIATGIWKWFPGSLGGNLWAQSVEGISGWKGNLANLLDPKAEVIVDMGL